MSERLLLPPRYHEIDDDTPLIFLAGPIQGAEDWQTPTAENLLAHNDRLAVASPRLHRKEADFNKQAQVFWELDHIWRASRLGGVAFWWAAQNHSLPYKEGRSYGQTSRFELGAISMAQKIDPEVRAWIGYDPAYTPGGGGSQEYAELMREWFVPGDEIFTSLDDMIEAIKTDTADL